MHTVCDGNSNIWLITIFATIVWVSTEQCGHSGCRVCFVIILTSPKMHKFVDTSPTSCVFHSRMESCSCCQDVMKLNDGQGQGPNCLWPEHLWQELTEPFPNCSIMPLDEAMEILLAINHLSPSLHYNSEHLSKQEIQLQGPLRK